MKHTIYQQLDKLLALFFILFVGMEGIWIPANSYLADYLLQKTGFLYLSYNNALQVLGANWLITLALVTLFVVNLLVAYWQIGAVFLGVHQLFDEEEQTLREFLNTTAKQSRGLFQSISLSKVVFVLLYASVLFPFIRRLLKVYFLNKFLIPEFILTYLTNNIWIAALLSGLALVLLWLGIRLLYVFPQLIFANKPLKVAVQYSWDKTSKSFWLHFLKLLYLSVKVAVLYAGLCALWFCIQYMADSFSPQLSFVFALMNYVAFQFTYYGVLLYFMVHFMAILSEKELPIQRAKGRTLQYSILLVVAILFGIEGLLYLQMPDASVPYLISHRGVDHENGVQNTLESLEATAMLKPDYIEMDIQETKDGEFVMMYDANLKALTGVDARPQELTLLALTQLEVSENGHTARIPSFDAYLERANQLGQKLLIEIKTSPKDSPQMVENFLKKYADVIKEKGHQIHSLDYQVVSTVQEQEPDIPIFFVLPYNTIFPQTKANGYTMEYSTLDEHFMLKSFFADKAVYDWTVNDEESIQRSLDLGVDGLITDELTLAKETITKAQNRRTYRQMLGRQMIAQFDIGW